MAILLRDRDAVTLLNHPARLLVGGAALVVAVGTFGLGLRRRRELTTRPLRASALARRRIITVGFSLVILSVLITAYLLVSRR
jgi:hypothetical protein